MVGSFFHSIVDLEVAVLKTEMLEGNIIRPHPSFHHTPFQASMCHISPLSLISPSIQSSLYQPYSLYHVRESVSTEDILHDNTSHGTHDQPSVKQLLQLQVIHLPCILWPGVSESEVAHFLLSIHGGLHDRNSDDNMEQTDPE